jgi:hypothetical protein
MSSDSLVPETRVLAIASHVVYGYVGNKMATLVMQLLGCDVAALNTVHFSNEPNILRHVEPTNIQQATTPATGSSKAQGQQPKKLATYIRVSARAISQTSMSCCQVMHPVLQL